MLQVINYPHPALRHQSKPLRRVDKNLKQMVVEMFELMYEHRGVGLAANQVNLPFQLFVVNSAGERGAGEELVMINPVIQSPKGTSEAEEGCLSIPGVYGQVVRPEQVHVTAWDLSGNQFDRVVDGMLARVMQHEYDHLQGVLFPDRMSESAKKSIADDLDAFEREYASMLRQDESVSASAVVKRLAELEAKYC
ncbi:MAG: peptide deformylase [Pirellulaceae bacterium]